MAALPNKAEESGISTPGPLEGGGGETWWAHWGDGGDRCERFREDDKN